MSPTGRSNRESAPRRRPAGDRAEGGESGGIRLQRVMADAGVASRRDCERLIEEGHVTVNGQVKRKLPVLVDPRADDIKVDGRPLPRADPRIYLMVNKPAKVLCTTRDDPAFNDARGRGRPTILDLVEHPGKSRLFPVGRLDFHSTGLVLLTNDGDLANRLTHPRHRVTRTYEVLVRRTVAASELDQIATAINRASPLPPAGASRAGDQGRTGNRIIRGRPQISPGRQKPQQVSVSLVKNDEGRSVLRITMLEGPNRSVEEVLARLGLHVKRLRRVGIGPIELTGVALGQWRPLTSSEKTTLKGLGSARAKAVAGPKVSKAAKFTATTGSGKPRKTAKAATQFAEDGYPQVTVTNEDGELLD